MKQNVLRILYEDRVRERIYQYHEDIKFVNANEMLYVIERSHTLIKR